MGLASLAGQGEISGVKFTRAERMQGAANQRSGLKVMQHIVRNEGIFGLYRGFGASLFTFVPSSAVW